MCQPSVLLDLSVRAFDSAMVRLVTTVPSLSIGAVNLQPSVMLLIVSEWFDALNKPLAMFNLIMICVR